MARVRVVLGVALAVVALGFSGWDQQVNWLSPVLVVVPLALLGLYGLAAIFGLGGPKTLRDAAFGLALFGGSSLLLGAGWSGSQMLSHAAALPLHLRAFNAIQGTNLVGTEQNGGFLAPADPTITALHTTRTATLHAASLAAGLVGAVLCVVLGRFAPLRRWPRPLNLAMTSAAGLGIACVFAWPGWWGLNVAFYAVLALILGAAVGACYGPVAARPRLFGFAVLSGFVFVFGSYRTIAPPFYPEWGVDPLGALLARVGMGGTVDETFGALPNVVVGYLPTPNPRSARIRLALLFAAIPVGLAGAGLAVALARSRRRIPLAGTATLMLVVAAASVVFAALRVPDSPWKTVEAQMILFLGVLAAFRARFGRSRAWAFFAGFAIFGLTHVALDRSNLRWNSPLARPVAKAAETAWRSAYGEPFAKGKSDSESMISGTPRYHHYSYTLDAARQTSSLAAGLLGGALCLLMVATPRATRTDVPA